MKSVYGVTNDRKQQVDICQRMICRMLDEDDTVKDLACKTVEELWFQDAPFGNSREKSAGLAAQDKTQLLRKVSIIMEVSGGFKDRNSPLEDLLHKIMSEKSDAEKTNLHRRYTEICECLIDGLVDASDLPEFVSTLRRLPSSSNNISHRRWSTVLGLSIFSLQLTRPYCLPATLRRCCHI